MVQIKKSFPATPVLTETGATFLWYGPRAPILVGDFNQWDFERAVRLRKAGSQAWQASLRFPVDAYIEYAFILDGKMIPDPGNPRTVDNGIDAHNHFFYMPEGKPCELAQPQPGVARGRVSRHSLFDPDNLAGGRRSVTLYQPPASKPCPLLVVFDGQDYLRRASLPVILDNLIAQKRIRPVALALVASRPQSRNVEYACNDATLNFIRSKVLPLAQEKLNLVDPGAAPGAYAVLGASMGGLIALYAGLRLPVIFGRVLSQSGAFEQGSVIYDLIHLGDLKPVKIWMDVGAYDSLKQDNRVMQTQLLEKGYPVSYAEYNGGHNYTAWRDHLCLGLEAVFG